MCVVALPLAAGGISLLPQWMLLAQRGDGKKNNKKGEEENIMLKIEHLTKSYGEKKAVDDLSLHIAPGEIYGFIGHNGAGKTTVMKLVTNLWKPTGGRVLLFGEPLTPTSYGVLKRMVGVYSG